MRNASWNGALAAGASTTIGADFSYSGTNTAPPSIDCLSNGAGQGGQGGQASFTQADIDAAVAAPLIVFAAPTSADPLTAAWKAGRMRRSRRRCCY